nr:MAG TPA: hypothetical protein [Caudoviricetes sp.]
MSSVKIFYSGWVVAFRYMYKYIGVLIPYIYLYIYTRFTHCE